MFSGEAGLIGNGLFSRLTATIDAAKRRGLLSSERVRVLPFVREAGRSHKAAE